MIGIAREIIDYMRSQGVSQLPVETVWERFLIPPGYLNKAVSLEPDLRLEGGKLVLSEEHELFD